MDLSQLDVSAKAEAAIAIRHPVTQAAIGIVITIAGPGSAAFIHAQDRRDATVRALTAKYKRIDAVPTDELRNVATQFSADCTLGWSGVELRGQSVVCNGTEALNLYRHPGFSWLHEQVSSALGEIAHFLPAPSNS